MSKIWIAGKGFDIDAKVVRWDEGPGYNGMAERCINPSRPCPGGGVFPYSEDAKNTRANRFALRPALRRYGRNPPPEAAQAVIRQCVLHHDGCPSSKTCFNVLHNERGLSCHFLLDNDGTIYQTVDLAFMAYHAAGFNAHSVGIELCNRGDAKRDPDYYRHPRRSPRDTTTVRIHGHIYYCFRFTPVQHEAMRALAQALTRALPNLPLEYPQSAPGQQAWSELPNALRFAGYLGHYHTTRRKWDPGPFDFKELCETSRGDMCFPVFSKPPKRADDRPLIPDDADGLESATAALYQLNERKSTGGFFPLGPYGQEHESRLWHGGVHLPGKVGQPVYAPFPGRLMAARMGPDTPVGSANFVLLRHDMAVGQGSIRFYSLYAHLLDDGDGGQNDGRNGGNKNAGRIKGPRPEWLERPAWIERYRAGRVILLDEPIEAGSIIGRYGQGGPAGYRQAQIHIGIFAAEEIIERIQTDGDLLKEYWQVIDGTLGGRFSRDPKLNDLVDTAPKDDKISRKELFDFFRQGSDRILTRNMATLHVSEWSGTSEDWLGALQSSADFSSLGDAELERLVDEQIAPTLWWTPTVAKHAKLPRDGVVYHYHPLSFIRFINAMRLQAEALGKKEGIGLYDPSEADAPPPGVTDDFDDVSGDSFVDQAELEGEEFDDALPLDELIQGFPE